MDFPEGIRGPDISKGEFVNFRFANSSLSLRIPKLIYNPNDHLAETDWTTSRPPRQQYWTNASAGTAKTLVYQTWYFQDRNSDDNIAIGYLTILIRKTYAADYSKPVILSDQAFRQYILNELIRDEKHKESDKFIGIETRVDWPSLKNKFYLETVTKPVLNGLRHLLDLCEKKSPHPMPLAAFVLDRDSYLSMSLRLTSLNYIDRKNPYSEELLHKFKMDLFEELLTHIQIDYSPDLMAQIEAFK